jgi:hypothetical protein
MLSNIVQADGFLQDHSLNPFREELQPTSHFA